MNPTATDQLADHLTCITLASRLILNPRSTDERQARAFAILVRSTGEAQRCREQIAQRI